MTFVAAMTMGGLGLNHTTPAHAQGNVAEFAAATGGLNGQFQMPNMARLTSGRFVVATSLTAKPLINSGTYFQIYSPLGAPAGSFTRVKPMLTLDDCYAKVAAAGTGFVVVYNWRQHIDSPVQIMAQRYSATGATLGTEFQVNVNNPGHILQHQVTGLADGGFVVTWSAGPNRSGSGDIYARRYNSTGVAVTDEFLVNTTLKNTQTDPAVAALANGGFVIAWSGRANAGYDIFAQRYAANGAKLGAELKLTSTSGVEENAPLIAGLHNGGFVAAWTHSHVADATIRGRRFKAAGAPNGAEFIIGGQNYGHWEPIALTVLDDDRFFVAYSKSGNDIYAKLLGPTAAADGTATEFRVNTTATAAWRLRPGAVALSDRRIFAAWEEYGGAEHMRRLEFPPPP
jgi:hypothetical protein